MAPKSRAVYKRKYRADKKEAKGKPKVAGHFRLDELEKMYLVDAYGQRLPLFPDRDIPADPIYGGHRPTDEYLEIVGVKRSTKKIGRHERVPFFWKDDSDSRSKAVVMSIYTTDPITKEIVFRIVCASDSGTTLAKAMVLLDDKPSDQGAPERVRQKVRTALYRSGTSCFWPGTMYRTHFRPASDFDVKLPTLDPWIRSIASADHGAEDEEDLGSLTVLDSSDDSPVVAVTSISSQRLITSFVSNRPRQAGPSNLVDLSHTVEPLRGFQSVIGDHFPPKRESAIKATALLAAIFEPVDLTGSDDEVENPFGGDVDEDDEDEEDEDDDKDDDDEDEEDEEELPAKKRRV